MEEKFSDEESLPGFKEDLIHSLESQKFIPSTTILMNAGRFNDAPLSACFVPPVDLRNNLKDVKKIVDGYHFSGMDTGFNFDDLKKSN